MSSNARTTSSSSSSTTSTHHHTTVIVRSLQRSLGSATVAIPEHALELRLALLLCWQLAYSSNSSNDAGTAVSWCVELFRHGIARDILRNVMTAQGFLERDLFDLSVEVLTAVTESLDDTEQLWEWGACVQIADHLQRHPRHPCPAVFRWLVALLRDGDVADRVDTLVAYRILPSLVYHACASTRTSDFAGSSLDTVLRIRPNLLGVVNVTAKEFSKRANLSSESGNFAIRWEHILEVRD